MLKGATNSNSAVGWRALDKACQVFSGMLTPPQKTIKLWTLFNRSQPSCVSSTHLICQAPLMPRVPPICPPRWASWAHSPQLWRALPSDAMITLSQHLCDNWPSEETARGIPLVRRLQDLAGSAPESWSPAPSSRVKTCNTCLQEVAVLWKTACLVSLSEKSTTSGLNDYRPINLTSPVMKMRKASYSPTYLLRCTWTDMVALWSLKCIQHHPTTDAQWEAASTVSWITDTRHTDHSLSDSVLSNTVVGHTGAPQFSLPSHSPCTRLTSS